MQINVWMNEQQVINAAPSSELYKGLLFVEKATSKDEEGTRALMHILYKNGTFIGTDGHRLHTYYAGEEIESESPIFIEGHLYHFISKKKKVINLGHIGMQSYPDFEFLFPDINPKKELFLSGIRDEEYVRVIKMMSENRGIKYNYFNDLPNESWNVKYYNEINADQLTEDSKLIFHSENMTAVIMPFKIKE